MKTYILDSYALLCLFDRKRKAEKEAVKKYLDDAEKGIIKIYMSKINEGEVFYKLYKYLGSPIAEGFREDLKRGLFPLSVVSVNDRRVEEASVIKAKYSVSYADAFCIELAKDMGLPVITGDPEFGNVENVVTVIPLV
ncbi:MAG TPA: type II toxin-antitoxin system VapC family toxin [Dissulfurispiraceae bacterium]|nr:type II toxin-antitoxin system VapC family toxin [Dissulfurispiraceae bacterium]